MGVAWDSTNTYVFVAHTTTPFLTGYKKSGSAGSAVLTKLTNPASLPSNNGTAVDVDRTDGYVAIAITASPYIEWYSLDSGTDTLTKLTSPTDAPTGSATGLTWSPTDDLLVVVTGNELVAYERSGSTLTLIENAFNSDSGSNFQGCSFSPDGKYLLVTSTSTPGYQLYRVYNNRFRAIPLRQTTMTDTDNYQGSEWGRSSSYMAVTKTNSPYVHITKGLALTPDVSVDNNGKDFPVIKTGL
jgi:WD40 repeat protein